MSLEDYTADDLKQELAEREEKKLKREKELRRDFNAKVLERLSPLLELMPHDRGSCNNPGVDNSRFHPGHGGAYCTKCALQEMLENDCIPDDVFISVDIRATLRPDN